MNRCHDAGVGPAVAAAAAAAAADDGKENTKTRRSMWENESPAAAEVTTCDGSVHTCVIAME